MEQRDTFLNISPLDHRYWVANRDLFDRLSATLSEQAAVRYIVRAEGALLRAHVAARFANDRELLQAINALEYAVKPAAVAAAEEMTHHHIRAVVQVVQQHVPAPLVPWVHVGATSTDILDTATAMRVRDAMRGTVIPLVLDLLGALITLAAENATVPQVGRTHGQAAVPITFGFAVAEYVSRLGQSAVALERLSGSLRGKLSGAVGAYNATSLLFPDPEALERDYLAWLGLERADYANQIVEPEHLLRLLLEINVAFGIIANLADDCRHLQRSEIAEVAESFGQGQVGSSTMPQKRNPWNSEHVKGLWKAFAPRVMSFYLDQISEHQRDLSNSASGRFVTDYIAGFAAAAARMLAVVQGLTVHQENMMKNLARAGDSLLAEPTYILLALSGRSDAHDIVKQATLTADAAGRTLKDVLADRPDLWTDISTRIQTVAGVDAEAFYSHPARYCGIAPQKTQALCKQYRAVSTQIRKKLKE